MSEKRPYYKLTPEEEAVFDKYLPEFLNAEFRSSKRKDIIDRAFQELLLLNPNIKREQVHNKYNNLLSKYNNKKNQASASPQTQQQIQYVNQQGPIPPPAAPQLPPPQQLPSLPQIPPPPQQLPPQSTIPPPVANPQTIITPPYPTQSFQIQRNDSLGFGMNPFDSGGNFSMSFGDQYFNSLNSTDFIALSSTPNYSNQPTPIQQTLDFSSYTYEMPTKIEDSTKDKLYSWLPDAQDKSDSSSQFTNELYDKIGDICRAIYNSQYVFKYDKDCDNQGIIFYDKDKLEFLQKAEESLINITTIFKTKLNSIFIYPKCNCCACITPPFSNITSKSRRSYNTLQTSPTVSRTNSFAGKTSADVYKQKEAYKNENRNEEGPASTNQIIDIKSQPFNVSTYSKLIEFRNLHLNDKLLSFFTGEFNEKTQSTIHFSNAESSTLVSFNLDIRSDENEADNQFLFCYPAFIYYCNEKLCHMLHFNGVEIETGFFLPSTSMIFYRENGVNRLYACGDKRVKEYTISGLDDYIKNYYKDNTHPLEWNNEIDPDGEIFKKDVKIEITNTFFIGDGDYHTTTMAIWNGQLVVGCNSTLHFWQLEGHSETKMIDSKENIDKANESKIDLNKVDWNRGKLQNKDKIEIKEMPTISSLSIIEKTQLNNYLAVASFQYPVIYVFDQEHNIVSRLISHTMGVTSLRSCNFNLFSSSLDRTTRIWNLNQDQTMMFFDSKSNGITEIEVGFFFDQMVIFTGIEGNIIQCWSVTNKSLLFDIELEKTFTPRKISFMSGKNQIYGDFAKLTVISEYIEPNGSKEFQTTFFEFI